MLEPSGTLVIELTYDCDMRCPWCVEARHVGTKKGPLPPEALCRLLGRAFTRPYKTYVFQGGEPLVYSHYMLEICDTISAKQPNACFRIFTNGTHLTYPLVEELNKRNVHATVALEADGYKGVTNFVLNHAKDPENALENIRLLHGKCLRIVATAEKIDSGRLADDILLLHNYISGCAIEVTLDLTNLGKYTLDDMAKLQEQYKKLKNKAPNCAAWLIPMQGFTTHCSNFAEWYILETDTIMEKCSVADRPETGCAAYKGRMKPEVYEAYTKITENF